MLTTLINAFKTREVRNKILITVGILLLYRVGCWLPLPGLDPQKFAGLSLGDNMFLSLVSGIGGNALQNGSWLAFGITPYINASIIIQLLTIAVPYLERQSKQGDDGRRKIEQITRYLTVILGIAQSVGVIISWARGSTNNEVLIEPGFTFAKSSPMWVSGVVIGLFMLGGTILTMWMGEKITELGVGNGISLLIFAGILATAAQKITQAVAVAGNIPMKNNPMTQGNNPITQNTATWQLVGFLIMVVLVFVLIVFIDQAERRVPIQYAKQIKGRKQYGGQSTHIPIKINATGVLPIIFATALISFPTMLFSMFPSASKTSGWYHFNDIWQQYIGVGTWPYSILVVILIFAFSYFYARIQFNPEEVSRNLQQYGGLIPGIRQGKPTADYLKRINNRITFFGAIFLSFIALVPTVLFKTLTHGTQQENLVTAFSATGLLIVVSVALDFNKQLEAQLMMKHYKGFLK